MKKYPIELEIAGNFAMWTRPDTGDSHVSYPAPTYSAVRNIFQSILWGQSIEIIPRQVNICNPLHYENYNTNYGGPLRSGEQVKKGNSYQLIASVLTDVRYQLFADVVEIFGDHESERTKEWRARFADTDSKRMQKRLKHFSGATKHASPGHAYQEIFKRRLKQGKCFHTPFLGWKEFTPTYCGALLPATKPVEVSTVLPSMFRDFDYKFGKRDYTARFDVNVEIKNGVLVFPSREEVHQ